MSYTDLVPSLIIQEFKSGDTCTGVAYTGNSIEREVSGLDVLKGMVHVSGHGTTVTVNGGLIPLSTLRANLFSKLASAWINLPGCTAITIYAVDQQGVEYDISTVSGSVLVLDALGSWDLLPGWNLSVKATGTISGVGKIVIMCQEWGHRLPFSI